MKNTNTMSKKAPAKEMSAVARSHAKNMSRLVKIYDSMDEGYATSRVAHRLSSAGSKRGGGKAVSTRLKAESKGAA